MQNFKNLRVWEETHEMILALYKLSSIFPSEERYHLSNQLRRAATSIASNLAEGCSRHSQKDKAHFVQMAYSSSNELEYQLLLAKDLGYISDEQYEPLIANLIAIKKMLYRLLKKIRESISRS